MRPFEELDSIRVREAEVCRHECHFLTLLCEILERGKPGLGRICRQHTVTRSEASTQGRYSRGLPRLVSVHDEQDGETIWCTVVGCGATGHGCIKVRLPRPGDVVALRGAPWSGGT